MMESLVQHGAEVESRDNNGRTPLSWAAGNGNTGPMKFLLKHGANIRTTDFNGATALSWAARKSKDDVETVRFLVEHNLEIDPKENTNGRTPFSFAAEKGHGGVMDVLLNHGADIDSKSNDGRTPLSFAAECGVISYPSPKFLVENGADIESKDNRGLTPLCWALERQFLGSYMVSCLLELGAGVEARLYKRHRQVLTGESPPSDLA
jgi:ankyrin repeat protein